MHLLQKAIFNRVNYNDRLKFQRPEMWDALETENEEYFKLSAVLSRIAVNATDE
jgi:hypothetical protein